MEEFVEEFAVGDCVVCFGEVDVDCHTETQTETERETERQRKDCIDVDIVT